MIRLWNDQYWLQPYEGWIVADQCDDGVRLTGEVSLLGTNEIRAALEFLQDPRSQGVPLEQVNAYLKTYPLYHNVTDRSINFAIPTIRPINIVPTYPEFYLNGDITIVHECGEEYLDAGIGDIRDTMQQGGVDACYTDAPGYFVVSYKVVPPGVNPDSIAYLPYI